MYIIVTILSIAFLAATITAIVTAIVYKDRVKSRDGTIRDLNEEIESIIADGEKIDEQASNQIEALIASNNEYEVYFNKLTRQLDIVLSTIRRVDIMGAFEESDEVGAAFSGIKVAIDTLKQFSEPGESITE